MTDIIVVAILVLVVGLWLGTPVYAEFRYAYPVILTLPLLLAVTCCHHDGEAPDLNMVD